MISEARKIDSIKNMAVFQDFHLANTNFSVELPNLILVAFHANIFLPKNPRIKQVFHSILFQHPISPVLIAGKAASPSPTVISRGITISGVLVG